MDHEAFAKTLKELAKDNAKYAEFNSNVVNTQKKVLGVRVPDMRKLAKDIAKGMDTSAVLEFLKEADKDIYEEVAVSGFIIVYSKPSETDKIALTREYLKYADSWALIDSFVDRMKRFDKRLWFNFAEECLVSKEEFTVRYGVIRLMDSFLNEEHLTKVFAALRSVKHEGYYVKMGMAWLYATAAIYGFEKTIAELNRPSTDPWTRGKALQKMLESYRITDEQKTLIRELRKKRGDYK